MFNVNALGVTVAQLTGASHTHNTCWSWASIGITMLKGGDLGLTDTIVDWGGTKPSITYGPKDNKVKVAI